jgi:hypothetical protein
MKRVFFVSMMFVLFSNIQAQDKMRIAVLELAAGVGVNQSDVDGISGMFTSALMEAGRFELVERALINKAIQEQSFQRSNYTATQVAEMGKILNVKKILVGDANQIMGEYNVDIRIINVTTGAVEASVGVTKQGGQSYRDMINQLANSLTNKLFPPAQTQTTPIQNQVGSAYLEKTIYDFGIIKESNVSATASFIVKNPTDEAITITVVRTTCGCLIPDWSKETIQPSNTGIITVKYMVRPGPFNRRIMATLSNGENIEMFVKGVVE